MAARFWVIGGVDTNWSTIGNWSLTSGGAGGQAVPLATDDVTFDGGGNGPCVLNTTFRVCLSLTVASDYTNTITFTNQLRVSGSITIANSAHTMTGAGPLRMIAAGTWTTNGKTIAVPVEIGGTTTFTCTLAGALTISGALTLTNTTSTIFAGAYLLTANDCTISGSQTLTLVNDVAILGLTTISDANVINGAFNWRTYSLTTTGATTGTATILFNGTGTWTGAAGALSNPVTINTGGTLTLSGTILYLAGTITWTAGTVSAGTSILSIGSSCTLNTAGMTWYSITISAALTLTINSLLSGTGTLLMPNAAVTLAGSAGFTFASVDNTAIASSGKTYTLTAGNTYTVTGELSWSGATAALTLTVVSSHASNKVALVIGPGATQDVGFVVATRVDSTAGQGVFDYKGTLTTCFNWVTAYPVNAGLQQPVYQVGI